MAKLAQRDLARRSAISPRAKDLAAKDFHNNLAALARAAGFPEGRLKYFQAYVREQGKLTEAEIAAIEALIDRRSAVSAPVNQPALKAVTADAVATDVMSRVLGAIGVPSESVVSRIHEMTVSLTFR
jgi:hypothetical protein